MMDLHLGDCLDILPALEAESVDTVITDPPYGLSFMGKWWDHGVPGVRYWTECLRVAKPGAMLCAFGGTRTHHRLMCAIEDAGWEIRDVLCWLYGSGFPKSHNIGKAIDKAAGAEREVVGQNIRRGDNKPYGGGWAQFGTNGESPVITAPATSAAALWDGYGTALKPAYEPIILAMKPLPGTFAQNALDYGGAGIWVDGCRVPSSNFEPKDRVGASKIMSERPWNLRQHGDGRPRITEGNSLGRWPANLLLSHAPGCECVGVRKVKSGGGKNPHNNPAPITESGPAFREKHNRPYSNYASPDGTETIGDWRCVEGCPVRMLDEQSGERPTGPRVRHKDSAGGFVSGGKSGEIQGHNDTGGASRYFTRFHYSAKASRSERELGLLGHIPCLKCGQLDSVTHMNAKAGKEEKCRRNGHPTVKPLDVCRWLCRLTKTPTGGVVLDPFMGSGRIPMAAILEGRDTIGIELERPSFEIAQAGVNYIQAEMVQARMAV